MILHIYIKPQSNSKKYLVQGIQTNGITYIFIQKYVLYGTDLLYIYVSIQIYLQVPYEFINIYINIIIFYLYIVYK